MPNAIVSNSNINIELVPVSALRPAPYNPRKWEPDAIKQLTQSIHEFGLVDPIIVNRAQGRENIVIGGHFRLKIAKDLGLNEVPVVYVDIPNETKERELNLRLNKNLGTWDMDILAEFDLDLLKDVGFDSKELDRLIKAVDDEFDVDSAIAEIKEPTSKPGEIYKLGRHRLMCGDATKKEDVDKMMDGKMANMVFTDPPYGDLVVTHDGYVGRSNVAQLTKYHKYTNDGNFDFKPVWELIENWECKKLIWGGNYFPWLPITTSWIIWDKRAGVHSWYSDCELAWTNFGIPARIYSYTWQGMIRAGEHGKRVHPTQKPIALMAELLKEYGEQEDIVLDLFGGSGTTLIAAEQIGRTCYMMELDPKYCDVIRARYAAIGTNA